MDVRIRREALRAAAKLAFGMVSSVALIDCGGRTVSSGSAGRADLPGPPDAACAYPTAVTLSQGPDQKPSFTTAELDCCAGHVESLIRENGASATVEGSDLGNCCNAIITAVDVGMMTFADVTSGARQACCFSGSAEQEQSRWNHNLCAPWGPPVPPGMDWTAEGVA